MTGDRSADETTTYLKIDHEEFCRLVVEKIDYFKTVGPDAPSELVSFVVSGIEFWFEYRNQSRTITVRPVGLRQQKVSLPELATALCSRGYPFRLNKAYEQLWGHLYPSSIR